MSGGVHLVRTLATAALILFTLSGCADEFQGRPPLVDGLHYPLATAVDEATGRLYVVNSNFDLSYRAASMVTYDLQTHKLSGGAATFGSFPGAFLLADSSRSDRRFGFLAIRGDNSLTWFNIEGSGDNLSFICSDNAADPGSCSGSHVITEGILEQGDDIETLPLGSDPYGLGFLPGDEATPDRLMVAAMKGGQLSLLELDDDGLPVLIDRVSLASGLHSAAVDAATGIVYLTNKQFPLLYRFKVAEGSSGAELEKLSSVTLPAPFSSVQYGRGIAFAEGGQRVLVTYRTPASLLFIDGADEIPDMPQAVVTSVPVGSKPGIVGVAKSGVDGSEIAYVPCYTDDTLWAVDVATATPIAVIPVGAGPYHVSTVVSDNLKRAYVTNFLDHTVSVVDIDPASPFYHTHIAEIH
jgi:DNA-binding beta-propeller fold protein YncE